MDFIYVLFAFALIVLFGVRLIFNIEINNKLNYIIMNQNQLAAELVALKQQNEKARLERLENVARLEQAIIDAGTISPEVQEALNALKEDIQLDDDVIPDTPVDPDTTEETDPQV